MTADAPIGILQIRQPPPISTNIGLWQHWAVARLLLISRGPAALLQAATGPDGKPLLGRISSKVGGLLEELNDMLGALEGIPAGEGER